MFVSFTYVFTPVRMVSCKGVYVISCGSFYVKLALFSELYLKLQTDFTARWCFWFSANDCPFESWLQLRGLSASDFKCFLSVVRFPLDCGEKKGRKYPRLMHRKPLLVERMEHVNDHISCRQKFYQPKKCRFFLRPSSPRIAFPGDAIQQCSTVE